MGRGHRKNYRNIGEKIEEAFNTEAYEYFEQFFESLEGNVVFTGTGGSYIPALYAESILAKNKNVFPVAMDPGKLMSRDFNKIDHIVAFSYSGYTPSVAEVMKKAENKTVRTLMTRGDKKFIERYNFNEADNFISYESDIAFEKSYVAMSPMFVPMSFFLRKDLELGKDEFMEYYKYIKAFGEEKVKEVFQNVDFQEILMKKKVIEVVRGQENATSANVFKMIMEEAGLAYTTIHEKYEYAHGRLGLNLTNNTPLTVSLMPNEKTPYDNRLSEFCREKTENYFEINSEFEGAEGEFMNSHMMLKLGIDIAEKNKMDLAYPKHKIRDANNGNKSHELYATNEQIYLS